MCGGGGDGRWDWGRRRRVRSGGERGVWLSLNWEFGWEGRLPEDGGEKVEVLSCVACCVVADDVFLKSERIRRRRTCIESCLFLLCLLCYCVR